MKITEWLESFQVRLARCLQSRTRKHSAPCELSGVVEPLEGRVVLDGSGMMMPPYYPPPPPPPPPTGGTMPPLTVSAGGNVTEGSAYSFSVSAGGPIGQYDVVMIYWQLETATGAQYPASLGYDVSTLSGSVSLTSNSSSATISIPTVGDLHDEYDETFRVRFNAFLMSYTMPTGVPQDLGTRDVVIIDDDAIPVLTLKRVDQFGQTSSGGVPYDNTVPEADGQARFNAYLDHGTEKQIILTSGTAFSGSAIGVPLSAFNSTAHDTDFELFSGRTQTFNPYSLGIYPSGDNYPIGMITVPINNDWWDEPLESFNLNISATNVTVASPQTVVSINDDLDDKPYVTIQSSLSVVEDDPNEAVISIQISNPSLATVSVDYATGAVTAFNAEPATPVEDYTSLAGTMVFLPGELSHDVTIEIVDDALWPAANDPWAEPEMFQVKLSNPVNSRLNWYYSYGSYQYYVQDTGYVSIIDENGFPFPNVSGPPSVLEGDPQPVTFTVTLPTTFEKTEVLNWKVYRDSSDGDYWEWNGGVKEDCICVCGEHEYEAPTPWGALLDSGSFTITPAGAKTFTITTMGPAANLLRDPDRVFRLRLEWENDDYEMYNFNYDTPILDDVGDPRILSLSFDNTLLYENTNDAPPSPPGPVAYDYALGTVTLEYGWSIPKQISLSIDPMSSTANALDVVMPSSVTIMPGSTTATFSLETVHDNPILSQPEGNETLDVVATPGWMAMAATAPTVTIVDTLDPNYFRYIVPQGNKLLVPSDRVAGDLVGDFDVRDSRYRNSIGGLQIVSNNGPFTMNYDGNITYDGSLPLVAGSTYTMVIGIPVDEFGRSPQRTLQIEIVAGNQAPVFVGNVDFGVKASISSPTYVGTVSANDPNRDQVRYSLIDPTGLLPFVVDSLSGRISTTAGFSASAGTSFTLNISASDRVASDPRIRTSTQAVTVHVDSFDIGAPVVGSDFVEVNHTGTSDIDVLANDFDPDGGTLSQLTIVDAPLNGTATVIGDGINEPWQIRFAAGPGSRGYETFTYSVRDADGMTSLGVVTIAVGITFGGTGRVLFEYNAVNAQEFNPYLKDAGWTIAIQTLKAKGYQWDTVPEITESLLLGSDFAVDFGKGEFENGILFLTSQPGVLDYEYSVSFDGEFGNPFWRPYTSTTRAFIASDLYDGFETAQPSYPGKTLWIGEARSLDGNWDYGTGYEEDAVNVIATFSYLTSCDTVEASPVVATSLENEPRALFSGSSSLFSNRAMSRPLYVNETNGNVTLWNNTIEWLIDGAILVSIQDASVLEGGELTFTLNLSEASSQEVSVNFATLNGTAIAGTDYTSSSGTITFAPNETQKTIQISTLGDALNESIEFLQVLLTSASGARIGRSTGTGMISDDDPQPTVSISDATVNEGGDFVFVVTLSGPSGRPAVSMSYSTADNTATSGSDYSASTGTLTFLEGETTKTITVSTINDLSDEFDESLTVTLSNLRHLDAADLDSIGTILDDDDPPTVSVSNTTVSEGGDLVFTVSVSIVSGKPITVDYGTSNGMALAGVDYTSTSGTLTVNAGQNNLTITVPTLQDALDEFDETLSLTLSAPTNSTLGTSFGIGTILDDDAPPILSIDDVIVGEGGVLTFTLTLSAISGRTIVVDYGTLNGSAISGTSKDFLAEAGSATFQPGETTKTVTVTTLQDSVNEFDETLSVVVSNPINVTIGDGIGIGTITDDDPQPTVSVSDVSVTEGGDLVFVVSLSAASGRPFVTADFATSDGTTTAGSDYLASSGTVTFLEGETSKTVTVSATQDLSDEFDETLMVTLSNLVFLSTGDLVGFGTILDDDDPPTINVDSVSVSEGGDLVFTVSLSAVSGKPITVDYGTSNGTALAGVDYTATGGTLTINAGQNNLTITVTTTEDTQDEADETLSLQLSNVVGATIGNGVGTGTILNDDIRSVSIDNATVVEGGLLQFTMTLSASSDRTLSVDYATANGTALSGVTKDYLATSGSVTFLPGETTKTVSVTTLEDVLDEAAETLSVVLSNPVNLLIVAGGGIGTITDNDAPPSLSISDASVTEGGDLVFTLTLSPQSGQSVTVDYATSNGTAIAGVSGDYLAASGTVTFLEGETSKTITVSTLDDLSDEFAESLTVTLSNAANATLANNSATGTINDNDDPPTVSVSNTSVSEGGDLIFTVSLSAVSGKPITVDYGTSNGTALAGVDYTATSGTLTINAGQNNLTITVPTLQDALDEFDETLTLSLSSPTNASLGTADGIGTILDNDNLPSVSIDDVSVTEGGDLVFTVTLSAVSGRDASVDYVTANGTAKSGLDYSTASGTLTFLAGQTSQTVTVATLNDVLNEAAETLTVTLSNGVFVTIGTGTGTGTINDDNDPKPVLTISDANVTEGGNLVFTLTLSTVSGQDVSVDYSTASGSATSGADFNSASGTVTFAEGELTKTITVTTINDALNEFTEDLTVTLTNAPNADMQDDTGIGTIDDNDPLPTLVISNATQTEGEGNLTFVVTLSAPSGKPITVDYSAISGTAVSVDDFPASSGTLTFDPGETSKPINIAATEDLLREGTETFTVDLSNATNATIADSSGLGTIIDDDPQIVIELQGSGGTFSSLNENATVDFGDHLIGSDIRRVFRITNLGDIDLDITSINFDLPNGFVISSALSSNPISANGGTGTFEVQLVTTAVSDLSVTMSILSNDPDNDSFDLTLTGTVFDTQPEIVVTYLGGGEFQSGGIVDFGATFTNEPVTKYFVINNTGDASLTVDLPGTRPGFSINDGAGLTATIPELGQSTPIKITFTATAGLGFFDQTLIATTNDLDEGSFALRLVGRVRDAGLVTIIDNRNSGYTPIGTEWPLTTAQVPVGTGFLDDYEFYPTNSSALSFAAGEAKWETPMLAAGLYRVSTTWLSQGQRPTENQYKDGFVQYDVFVGTGAMIPSLSATLNQRADPDDLVAAGTAWEDIGYVLVTAASSLEVRLYAPSSDSKQRVTADAVRFERLEPSDDILYLPGGRDTYHIDVRTNDVPNGDLDVRAGSTTLTGLNASELPKVWNVSTISGGGLVREGSTNVWKKSGSTTTVTINPDGSQTVHFADPFAPDLTGFNYELGVDPSVVFAFSDVAPIVKNDNFSTSHGHSLTFDVLANDLDPQGDALFATIGGVANGHFETVQPGVQRIVDDSRLAIEAKDGTTWTLILDYGSGPQTIVMNPGEDHGPLKDAIITAGLPSGVSVETRTARIDPISGDMLLAVKFVNLPAGMAVSASISGPPNATLFERGRLTSNANGTHTYAPDKTFFQAHGDYTEEFRYVARDAASGGNQSLVPALAKIHVINETPFVSTPEKVRLIYKAGAPNLYRVGLGAFDADGDTLTYQQVASTGGFSSISDTLDADGSLVFRVFAPPSSGIRNGFTDFRISDGRSFSQIFTVSWTVWDKDVVGTSLIDGPIAGTFFQDPQLSLEGNGWNLSGYAVDDNRETSAYESLGSAVVDMNAGTFSLAQPLDVDLRQTTDNDGAYSLTYNSQAADRQPIIHTRISRENSEYELDTTQEVRLKLKWYRMTDTGRSDVDDAAYGGTDQVFNTLPANTLTAGLDDYQFTFKTGLDANGLSLAERYGNGVYLWEVEATFTIKDAEPLGTRPTATRTLTMSGEVLLTDNDTGSGNPFAGFGNGWGIAGLPSLWYSRNKEFGGTTHQDDTVILVDPASESRLFVSGSGANSGDPWRAVVPGYRTSLPKELGTLTHSRTTNQFTYVAADQTVYTFEPAMMSLMSGAYYAQLRKIDPVAGPDITFSYLMDGRLQSITSADGSITTFVYSLTDNKLDLIQMPGGRTLDVTVAAGADANLDQLTGLSIANFVKTFAYNSGNRLESDTFGSGLSSVETHFSYDTLGLLNGVTLGSGASSSAYGIRPASLYTPDPLTNQLPSAFADLDRTVGELVLPTNDLQKYDSTSGSGQNLTYGLRKYYFFDANGRRDQESLYATTIVTAPTITSLIGNPITDENWQWDNFDNVTYFTDTAGRETRFTYDYNLLGQSDDVFNKLVEEFHFFTQAEYQYETTHGWLTKAVDAQGERTDFIRNSRGQTVLLAGPELLTETFSWNSTTDLLQSHTDSRGLQTTFDAYDGTRRVTQQTAFDPISGESQVTSFVYTNTVDEARTTGGSAGTRTTVTYDELHRATESRVFNFDGTNSTLLGLSKQEFFDNGLLKATEDGVGVRTEYSYDFRGWMNLITAGAQVPASSETTLLSYNSDGSTYQILSPDGHTETFFYDPQQRKQWSLTDRIFLNWDASNNPIFDKMLVETTSDVVGNITKVENKLTGLTTDYKYDSLDRVIEETQQNIWTSNANQSNLKTKYNYDAVGDVVQTTRPDGVASVTDYDALGNVTFSAVVVDGKFSAGGAYQTAQYDSAGDLFETTEYRTTPSWSGSTVVYSPRVAINTTLDRDGFGRITTQTDPDGETSTFAYSYDSTTQRSKVTTVDRNGITTSQLFDGAGQLRASIDAAGAKSNNNYDLTGRLIEQTLQDGSTTLRQTEFGYDDLGRQNSVKAYDNISGGTFLENKTKYTFGSTGRQIESTDARGFTTIQLLDSTGRVTKITQPAPGPSAGGGPADHGAPETTFAYGYGSGSSLGLLETSVFDPLGRRTTTIENQLGWTLSTLETVSPTGGVYPSTSSVTKINQRFYDDIGRVIRVADRNGLSGNGSRYQYDDDTGTIFKTIDVVSGANGPTTTSLHDSGGRQVSVMDPSNNETRWGYDVLGRVIDETTVVDLSATETNRVVNRTWNYNGLITTSTDRIGRKTIVTVDPVTRTSTEQWLAVPPPVGPAQPLEKYVSHFDAAGQLISQSEYTASGVPGVDPPVSSVTFDFDDIGRAIEEFLNYEFMGIQAPTSQIQRTYFATGQRDQVDVSLDMTPTSTATGQQLVTRTNYNIDNLGRINGIQQNHATAGSTLWASGVEGPDKSVKFKYNADGARNEVVRLNGLTYTETSSNQRGITNFAYQPDARLDTITHKTDRTSGTLAISNYGYDYDPDTARVTGHDSHFFIPTQLTAVREEIRNYGYDSRGQLLSESVVTTTSGTVAENRAYRYDDNGNRLGDETYSNPSSPTTPAITNDIGRGNRTLEDARFIYRYDAEGNLIERTRQPRSPSEPVDFNKVFREVYTWDHHNRLIQVEQFNEPGDRLFTVVNKYDGLNRHIATEVTGFSFSGGTTGIVRTGYVLDGMNPVLDINLHPVNTRIERAYLLGPAVNEVLAVDVTDTSITRAVWTFADPLGTARSVAWFDGTAGTWSFQHRQTDSFGNLYAIDGADTDVILNDAPRFWAGHRFDTVTSLYDMKARWYDPQSGRMLTNDPLGFNAGDANLYRYVNNSPINGVDPDGQLWGWAAAGIGAGVGTATYIVGSWITGNEITYGGLAGAAASGAVAGLVFGALTGDVTSLAGLAAAGAASGAAAGFTGSVVQQGVDSFNASGRVDVNWGQVGASTLGGAVGGAIAAPIIGANPAAAGLGRLLLGGVAGGAGGGAVVGGITGGWQGTAQGAWQGAVYGGVGAGFGSGVANIPRAMNTAVATRPYLGVRMTSGTTSRLLRALATEMYRDDGTRGPRNWRPEDFGGVIADDPVLLRFWNDAITKRAGSSKDNVYKRAVDGRLKPNEDIRDAFNYVNKDFLRSARSAGYDIAEVHHWNYSLADFPDMAFNPRNLVPTSSRSQHELIHFLTTGSSGNWSDIFAGPTLPRHRSQ